jgi:hypothetical protein
VLSVYGRDFSDTTPIRTPIRGVILGGGRRQLSVTVDVDPI